jgi:DNA repair protein SbcC/Rad50
MGEPRLHNISIENFRSIDLKVEVRLDAPVVLIHGQNGAGKTSLLSAIELALTGAVPSMERADARYKHQLLHQGADKGRIILGVEALEGAEKPFEVSLTTEGLKSSGTLNDSYSKFFNERCYLPQSALTQLLTIYQESDSRLESLLSRFVSELLGLDRLDALELGLEPARDLRNARKLATNYGPVEDEIARLRGELNRTRAQLAAADAALAQTRAELEGALTTLGLAMPATQEARAALEERLRSGNEEAALGNLADGNRQLLALRREYARQGQTLATLDASQARSTHEQAQQQLAAWRSQFSSQIDEAITGTRSFFPDAQLEVNVDPDRAVSNAISAVLAEIQRLAVIDSRAQSHTNRLIELEDALKRNATRISELDREIALIAAETGPLSLILSELLTHVHGDDCPVCGRDYRDVSKEPLTVHVARRIAELSDRAERLRVLTAERSVMEREAATLRNEKENLTVQSLTAEAAQDIQDRAAKLQNLAHTLTALRQGAGDGTRVIAAESDARQTLARITNATSEERALRSALAGQAVSVGLPAPAPTEALESIFEQLDAWHREMETTQKARLETRTRAVEQLSNFTVREAQVTALREAILRLEADQARVSQAFSTAEAIRADVRKILSAAANTRTMIVGRVFNGRLNSLWRDLFVRLAPAEAFVPAFRVPTNPTRKLEHFQNESA